MAKQPVKKTKGKVSYQNDFYSDLSMNDMLYGVILRSNESSGIVTSISAGELPDGYFLFTARDVPGNNLISTPYGKVPVFSEGNISYKGEPLGIIAGPDENKCREYLEEIEIHYDKNTIEEYLEGSSENEDKVTEKVFSNILASRTLEQGPCFEKDEEGNVKGIEAVFDECDYITEGPWSDALRSPVYTEPNGAICIYDNENLTVYTPSLWLSDLRRVLCEALKLNSSKVIIKKTKASGKGTNNIWYNSIIATQASVAAFHTGKPVKLVYTRDEQEKFMETVLPISITHKTGIDSSGKLKAMQIKIDVDAGASNPFIQEILDRLVIGACGCYNPVNISINATAYSSSNAPSSIELPLIDSSAFFAVENQIYSLSTLTGLTPYEIKKANIQSLNKDKYSRPFALNFTKAEEIINAVTKQSDYNRKFASYHLESINRTTSKNAAHSDYFAEAPLRGIGLSCGYEGTGYYGSGVYSNQQNIELSLDENKILTIHCPQQSSSIRQIWETTASQILKIPVSSIKFNTEFNSKEEPLIPDTIYSNITIMTTLLKKCCTSLAKKMEKAKLPLTIKKSFSSTTNLWNSQDFSGVPFHTTSFAAAVVELELDQCTFRENIRGIWIVINGGKILNLQAAESTVKLNIQKVLISLVENSVIDTENIHISFCSSDSEPLQIGELVHQVLPAAYTQALSQAITRIVNKLPLQTDSLYNFYNSKIITDEEKDDSSLEKIESENESDKNNDNSENTNESETEQLQDSIQEDKE